MNKKKKQKWAIIIIVVVTIAMVSSIFLSQTSSLKKSSDTQAKKSADKDGSVKANTTASNSDTKKEKTQTKATNTTKEFRVVWGFADIDKDFVIQAKDSNDGDKTADYVFVKFTKEIMQGKGKNSAVLSSNYKLDGKPLPKGSTIVASIQGYDEEKLSNKITIKLPNGYLKGVNSNHTLQIAKDIQSKDGKAISGDLSLKLSYSKSQDENVAKNTKIVANANKGMPEYTIEQIGKQLPYNTLVVISLHTKTPQNYKVYVGDHELPLRKKKTGEQVFIDTIGEDYTQDEVKSLIKIKKVK